MDGAVFKLNCADFTEVIMCNGGLHYLQSWVAPTVYDATALEKLDLSFTAFLT